MFSFIECVILTPEAEKGILQCGVTMRNQSLGDLIKWSGQGPHIGAAGGCPQANPRGKPMGLKDFSYVHRVFMLRDGKVFLYNMLKFSEMP